MIKQDIFTSILKKKIKNFSKYPKEYEKIRFINGKIPGNPGKLDYNDSGWDIVTLPYKWNIDKDVWFRKKIIVPEKIKGIAIIDSKLEVGGYSNLFANVIIAEGELFIDGQKIFKENNWTDFRYRNLISSKVVPGEEHIVAFHFAQRKPYMDYYPRGLNAIEFHYSKIDDIIFEIESFIAEIEFSQILTNGKEIVDKILEEVEFDKLKNMPIKELLKLIDHIREKISVLRPLAKEYIINLIGHAHIDMNWLWEMDETTDVCKNTLSTALKLMNDFPNFCFSQSQAFIYALLEKKMPTIFKKIKKKVNEGNWEITASSWVELDLNMVNGESIIRQILYAKKYIMEKFNTEPKVFWSPDTFGHPFTLPQILKKCGVDYYYFTRASKKEIDLFWWEGIDGSRVLAFNSFYAGNLNSDILTETSHYYKKSMNIKETMYVYGIGDHGGGPTYEDLRFIEKLREKSVFPKLKFSTIHNYFDTISKQDIDIPIEKDEFNPIFDGCYTTHWDTKLHNRMCERLLLAAETLSAVAGILGSSYTSLEEPWKITLFNQFHDILPGSAI